jgi:hypothetical protein
MLGQSKIKSQKQKCGILQGRGAVEQVISELAGFGKICISAGQFCF